MKTPSSGPLGIRKRSPSRAPPLSGLCGSHASTATLRPCLRRCSMSLPMRVLLPTPPLPVNATTRLGVGGVGRCARLSAPISPRPARLSRRARAKRSPPRKRFSSVSSMSRLASLLEKIDYVLNRRARAKDVGNAELLQFGDVRLGNDAAHQHTDLLKSRLPQE